MTLPTTPPAGAPAAGAPAGQAGSSSASSAPPAAAGSTLLTAPPPAKPDGQGPAANTDPPKGTENNEAGKPQGDDAAPAPLKLKLPEGMKADDALIKGFEPIARELKLDDAGAQKLVDLYAGRQQQLAKEAAEAHAKQVDGWANEVKADKELGGDKFPETQQLVANVMTRFNDPGLVEVLNTSGLGNHPALVRFVARIGKAIADDSIKGAGGGAEKKPRTEQERLDRFYDHPDSQKRK
jgi:hypothetical protein